MPMQPSNPVVGGTVLRIPAIQSPNFVAGATGWQIKIDGTATFSNVTIVNGTVTVVGATQTMALDLQAGTPSLSFWNNATPTVISTVSLFNTNGLALSAATYVDGVIGSVRPSMILAPGNSGFGFSDSVTFNAKGGGVQVLDNQVILNARRDLSGSTTYMIVNQTDIEFHLNDSHAATILTISADSNGYAYLNGGASQVWQNVAFYGGWANYFNGYDALQNIAMPDGTIRLHGVAVYSGASTSSSNICQLNTDFTPNHTKTYQGRMNGGGTLTLTSISTASATPASTISVVSNSAFTAGATVYFDDITWEKSF